MRYYRSKQTQSIYREDEMAFDQGWEPDFEEVHQAYVPKLPEVKELIRTISSEDRYEIDGQVFMLTDPPRVYQEKAEDAERQARIWRAAEQFVREREEAEQKKAEKEEVNRVLDAAREALTALGTVMPSADVVPLLDVINAAQRKNNGEIESPW